MNPVKFKISSEDRKSMTEVKGMTVFNTEDVGEKFNAILKKLF